MSSINLHISIFHVFESTKFSLESLHLWYARLGHANFNYHCQLFPLLNKACQKFKFSCIVCELSKHIHFNHIPRMHRAPCAFDIIHFDIW